MYWSNGHVGHKDFSVSENFKSDKLELVHAEGYTLFNQSNRFERAKMQTEQRNTYT